MRPQTSLTSKGHRTKNGKAPEAPGNGGSVFDAASKTIEDLVTITERYLREIVACKFEGDICDQLQKRLGSGFYRGDPCSGIDAAIEPTAGSGRMVGVELKTAVMNMGLDERGEPAATTSTWTAQIDYQERQRRCAMFLVSWPMLRNTQYWTILHHGMGLYSDEGYRRISLDRGNCKSFIDLVVPPFMWPFTRHSSVCLDAMESLKSRLQLAESMCTVVGEFFPGQELERQGEDLPLPFQIPINTIDDIKSTHGARIRGLADYIASSFSAFTDQRMSVGFPTYAPDTCPISIRLGDRLEFLVEVRQSMARFTGSRHPDADGVVGIAHLSSHPNGNSLLFGPLSRRWTFMLSGLGASHEVFQTSFGSVPRRMLLLHRREVPPLWRNNVQHHTELRAQLPHANIVDMRDNVAAQMAQIFAKFEASDLRLPELEPDVKYVAAPPRPSHNNRVDEILLGMPKSTGQQQSAVDRVVDNADANPYLQQEVHLVHRRHQMQAHAQLVRSCRSSRQGLPFDFDMVKGLRRYAFTPYRWTDPDIAYLSERPLCLPVQMFELDKHHKFVYLSFGRLRWHSKDCLPLVHPYVANVMREDASKQLQGLGQRIFLLEGQDAFTGRQDWTPVYAVPSSATSWDLAKSTTQAWSKWIRLTLKTGYRIDQFRFDSYKEIVAEISRVWDDTTSHISGNDYITFKDTKLACVGTRTIFEELWPGYSRWL